jgi:hypothetical protein
MRGDRRLMRTWLFQSKPQSRRAAQPLAAADPAGVRRVGPCLACQAAVEWGYRCPSRRAAELEAVGRRRALRRLMTLLV